MIDEARKWKKHKEGSLIIFTPKSKLLLWVKEGMKEQVHGPEENPGERLKRQGEAVRASESPE